MNIVNLPAVGWIRPIFAVVLIVLITGTAGRSVGQENQNPDQTQRQGDKNGSPTPPAPIQSTPAQDQKPEVKITPREAEELFHSVDEIMAFDSKQTGLPIKKQVKRRLTNADRGQARAASQPEA